MVNINLMKNLFTKKKQSSRLCEKIFTGLNYIPIMRIIFLLVFNGMPNYRLSIKKTGSYQPPTLFK